MLFKEMPHTRAQSLTFSSPMAVLQALLEMEDTDWEIHINNDLTGTTNIIRV
jgi:hypothetical protein